MGQVIRLHGDRHEQIQDLLPWYANGSLGADEEALVEEHLLSCEECREDLARDRVLALHVASLPTPTTPDFAKLRARIESDGARLGVSDIDARLPLLRRRVPLGWAVAAQAAAIVGMIGAGVSQRLVTAPYLALGTVPTGAVGNALVIFRADATERAMREALRSNAARLVGGPTDANAYILQIAPANRATALTRLRANPEVTLAEPIDETSAP